MPKQVDVLVKEIIRDNNGRPTGTGEQITISYKSFLMLNDPDQPRFELLGEVEAVDTDGNVKLREGNPNLDAQYRQRPPQMVQRDAAPVVSSGPSEREKELERQLAEMRQMLQANQNPPAVEPKKRGRQPKAQKELEGAGV